MNWFKRDHRNIFVLVLVKKKKTITGELGFITSSFILLYRPSLPKKAIVRYRFQVQLGTIAVLFYGTVCPLLLGKQSLWLTFDRCFKAFQLTWHIIALSKDPENWLSFVR